MVRVFFSGFVCMRVFVCLCLGLRFSFWVGIADGFISLVVELFLGWVRWVVVC